MGGRSSAQNREQYGKSVKTAFSHQSNEPWTETVGWLKEVSDESITLDVSHVIRVSKEDLARLKRRLVKGSRVGVLVLDDGSIRVRKILDRQQTDVASDSRAVTPKARSVGKGKIGRIFD